MKLRKTILKITFDPKKKAIDVRDYGIKSDDPARDNATILFAFASCIVGKLKSMPIDAKTARKCFDLLCGEMEKMFCETFPNSEEEETHE